jgi:GT2 family glycosyltransferase
MLTYSVVICTLDRLDGLKRCIVSWLNERPLPCDIIVVHGREDGALEKYLLGLVAGKGLELCYLRMPASLVRQRNAGLKRAKGDIVFFADDDAIYLNSYAENILEIYEDDFNKEIGGVQGTIINANSSKYARWGIANLFWFIHHNGDGTLQPSAWPSFHRPSANQVPVEVFSGTVMSFRREVLQEFHFDEALAGYWVGDDFDIAYRVSRKFKLIQAPNARAIHYQSPVGRDNLRRLYRMMVVNHYYLFNKHFGKLWNRWFCWAWSDIGQCFLAVFWYLVGKGPGGLLGMIDGYRELLITARRGKIKAPPQIPGRSPWTE